MEAAPIPRQLRVDRSDFESPIRQGRSHYRRRREENLRDKCCISVDAQSPMMKNLKRIRTRFDPLLHLSSCLRRLRNQQYGTIEEEN
jgi:hypothetical protein